MNKKIEQQKTEEISVSDLEAIRVPRPTPKRSSPAPRRTDAQGRQIIDDPFARTIIDNRYEVVRCLGTGAMGSVFLVKHLKLGKRFALKMINPEFAELPEYVSRFRREAAACGRLDHPNCISVTDFGQTTDGKLFLVMEYVDGVTLSDMARNGPLPIPTAIEYIRQVLLGLKHAHGEGLIHRDIKLENLVKCRREDGQTILKILDFGMAKEPPQNSSDPKITRQGVVMGTPQYMAPEQIRNDAIDGRVDLYAVGVTLFRLITGRLVFESDNYLDLFTVKLKRRAPTMAEVTGSHYPPALEAFIAKALERRPADRFASASEMLAALNGLELKGRGGPRSVKRRFDPVLRSAAAFFGDLRAEVTYWYRCPEGDGPPTWPRRLRGLVATRTGRVVLIRSLALMLLLTGVIMMLFRSEPVDRQAAAPPPEVENPSPPAAPASASRKAPAAVEAPAVVEAAGTRTPSEIAVKEERSDPVLIEASLLIEQKKCRKAAALLEGASDPGAARARHLQGQVAMCLGQKEEALEHYRRAVEKDDRLRTDTGILEDAKRLVAVPKVRLSALDFMADNLGEPALPALIHFAGRHPNREVRHHALTLVERLGALENVDRAAGLELDLNQAKSCKEKREIVQQLAALGTRKARQVLVRARDAEVKESVFRKRPKHGCVRPDIIKALAEMRKAENAA